MITKKILIFGASGQIGRHLIRKLTKNNYKVTAVTRNTHQKGYILKTQAPIGYLDIEQVNIFDNERITELISNTDICINLVGILFEKGKISTFNKIHTEFPDRISKICKQQNIDQFIHFSALGLEKAKDSKYALSKLNGEKKIRDNFNKATIIKPSIVHSVDDSFTTRFLTLLKILPVFPLYYSGSTKFSPIHVSDVVELIFYVISKELLSKDIEAIGPEILTFKEIIQKLLNCIDKKRLLIPMPLILAKISATFFQLFPNPLISIDQLNLLKYDNIKSDGGITNFDIGCPSKIFLEESVKSYSFSWRDGGQFSIKKDD
ncbi:MAG: complex I NDUFA9 subunit family protein [Pelagibacterales bacterium]|nr:complex I NDUFA9 subunit family protein [Pelagibacterales bacterium]